jgi:hypothetical protein
MPREISVELSDVLPLLVAATNGLYNGRDPTRNVGENPSEWQEPAECLFALLALFEESRMQTLVLEALEPGESDRSEEGEWLGWEFQLAAPLFNQIERWLNDRKAFQEIIQANAAVLVPVTHDLVKPSQPKIEDIWWNVLKSPSTWPSHGNSFDNLAHFLSSQSNYITRAPAGDCTPAHVSWTRVGQILEICAENEKNFLRAVALAWRSQDLNAMLTVAELKTQLEHERKRVKFEWLQNLVQLEWPRRKDGRFLMVKPRELPFSELVGSSHFRLLQHRGHLTTSAHRFPTKSALELQEAYFHWLEYFHRLGTPLQTEILASLSSDMSHSSALAAPLLYRQLSFDAGRLYCSAPVSGPTDHTCLEFEVPELIGELAVNASLAFQAELRSCPDGLAPVREAARAWLGDWLDDHAPLPTESVQSTDSDADEKEEDEQQQPPGEEEELEDRTNGELRGLERTGDGSLSSRQGSRHSQLAVVARLPGAASSRVDCSAGQASAPDSPAGQRVHSPNRDQSPLRGPPSHVGHVQPSSSSSSSSSETSRPVPVPQPKGSSLTAQQKSTKSRHSPLRFDLSLVADGDNLEHTLSCSCSQLIAHDEQSVNKAETIKCGVLCVYYLMHWAASELPEVADDQHVAPTKITIGLPALEADAEAYGDLNDAWQQLSRAEVASNKANCLILLHKGWLWHLWPPADRERYQAQEYYLTLKRAVCCPQLACLLSTRSYSAVKVGLRALTKIQRPVQKKLVGYTLPNNRLPDATFEQVKALFDRLSGPPPAELIARVRGLVG